MMFCVKYSFIFIILCIFNSTSSGAPNESPTPFNTADCRLDISKDLVEPEPLFIVPNESYLFYPQGLDGIINFSTNDVVELFCQNGLSLPINVNLAQMACMRDTTFLNVAIRGNFSSTNFKCRSATVSTARRKTGKCFKDSTIIEVGFVVQERFIHVMDICHDEQNMQTHFVHHLLGPQNIGYQRNVGRPGFFQGEFHKGIPIDNLYQRNTQRATIARILGSNSLAEELISSDQSSNYFLSRGHLAAKTDYIFGTEQRATFFLLNVAPQWQTLNGGNWESVETSLRRFVNEHNLDVEVFTGTYGVLTVPDSEGEKRELTLFWENNQAGIPVPKLFYKIIYNALNKAGVVLIGVNNPYATLEDITKNYVICKDVSHVIHWVSWDRLNLARGYSYACDINDFLHVVQHIPKMEVDVLLTFGFGMRATQISTGLLIFGLFVNWLINLV